MTGLFWRSAAMAGLLLFTACAPDKDRGWDALRDRFIEDGFRLNPAFAVSQGRHEYDGQLPDWSDAGIAAEIAMLRQARGDTIRFNPEGLDPARSFERHYLLAEITSQLFWLEVADWPHRNPSAYIGALDPAVYLTRPYADPETRMRAFIAYLQAVPPATRQIGANLAGHLAGPVLDFALAAFGGYAEFFDHQAAAAFEKVDAPELQSAMAAGLTGAATAMRDLATTLEAGRDQGRGNFAMGAELFARMIRDTEGVDLPLDRLEAIGRDDLARNQWALREACASFAPGESIENCVARVAADKPDDLLAAARTQLPALRAFVEAKGLVSIPGDEQALVEQSPPYNSQNAAYIDIPGPYDLGLPSVYYISPPDPDWPEEVRKAYIPGVADLEFISVHEVWPGHFLQFLHARRSASKFGQLFVGYAFAEGWAHYAEEMMWEAGLGDGDPKRHVGQLLNALLRDVRFLSAIGLHTGTMTVEQSRAMFVEDAFQDEGNARQQAARGAYDPAYLNYTLGKLMIRRLRDDWTRDRGGRAAWRKFHDAFLSYGGPPIPLVRAQMLGEDEDAAAVF